MPKVYSGTFFTQVDKYGEVIMVLGVRSNESHSRSIVMEKHRIEGKVLRKHTTLANALVFAPIEDFSTDDVWKYLMTKNPNTWGSDNEFLMGLYQDSQDGECPLMVDKEKPSCGNSRFGCWACTVVQEDKSLKGFIKTAHKKKDWETVKKLQPLADLRNWLKDNRNKAEYRETKRQDGSIYKVETNEGQKIGLGSYKFTARKIILEKLLEAQKETGVVLISKEELELIQDEWNNRLGDLTNSVNETYYRVYEENLFISNQIMEYTHNELDILEGFCEEDDVSIELLKRLIRVEHKYYGMQYKNHLYQDFDSILQEDWLHKDEISGIKFGDADDN